MGDVLAGSSTMVAVSDLDIVYCATCTRYLGMESQKRKTYIFLETTETDI
jgi:hypothetical protein